MMPVCCSAARLLSRSVSGGSASGSGGSSDALIFPPTYPAAASGSHENGEAMTFAALPTISSGGSLGTYVEGSVTAPMNFARTDAASFARASSFGSLTRYDVGLVPPGEIASTMALRRPLLALHGAGERGTTRAHVAVGVAALRLTFALPLLQKPVDRLAALDAVRELQLGAAAGERHLGLFDLPRHKPLALACAHDRVGAACPLVAAARHDISARRRHSALCVVLRVAFVQRRHPVRGARLLRLLRGEEHRQRGLRLHLDVGVHGLEHRGLLLQESVVSRIGPLSPVEHRLASAVLGVGLGDAAREAVT